MLVFSNQLCELLPLWPSLWFNSPHPFTFLCVNKYTVYTYTVCKGGYGVLGLRQINTCRKLPLKVNFLDDDIMHCLLWVLSLHGCGILDIFGLPDPVVEEGGDVVLASAHLQVDRFIAAGLVIHLLFAKTVFFKSSVRSNVFSLVII